MNGDFGKKVLRLGMITTTAAIIANFVPVLYLWIVHGVIPTGGELVTIFTMMFAAYGVSWIVQPLSFYGGLGNAGSFICWVAGSATDVRIPALNMAQEATNTEPNTPEGEAIGTMGIATSVFVTAAVVSIFSLIGSWVIPMLPPVITGAFTYMLPSLFAAVYVSMAIKNFKQSLPILALGIICVVVLPGMGVPGAVITLITVVAAIVYSIVLGKATGKSKQ